MTPVGQITTLPPDQYASEALETLAGRNIDKIPVVDHGRLLNMVGTKDVAKSIAPCDAHSRPHG